MASVVKNFWKNKNVFLTGHTGFKGSWLSLWLNKMGANVTGYALPPLKKSLYTQVELSSRIKSHYGDVSDIHNLKAVMAEAQPEIVIHMAAQALVKYSYKHPVETYRTNVMGTVHVLEESLNLNSVRAIVNVTSDKCYENQEREAGYTENEPMGGYDPYSSSKGCAELVTSAYYRSYYQHTYKGLASARAGNVIGGGDWSEDRLLPDIFRAIEGRKPVVIRNPQSIRPWQHVLEPLSGYLLLAQRLYDSKNEFSEGFNFGPEMSDAKPVEYVVQKITSLWGDGVHYEIEKNYSGPHEASLLRLDITKAKKKLNWQPTWNIEESLEKTVDWYKNVLKNSKCAFDKTLEQIEIYEKNSASR